MSESTLLPPNWKVMELEDVCDEISGGGTPPRSQKKFFVGNIPWVVIKDIVPKIMKTSEYLTKEGLKNSSAKLWPAGTVILSTGATVGKVGIAGVNLCTKQGIVGIVPKKFLDNHYLRFFLESITEELKHKAEGVTIKEIYRRNLKKIKIPIPSITIQKEIVDILSTSDKILTDRKKTLVAANQLTQSLFVRLFENEIVEGTSSFPLEEIAVVSDVDHKMPKKVNEGIPLISTKDFTDEGKIDFLNAKNISIEDYDRMSKRVSPKKGDILFSRYGTLGKCVKIETDKRFTISYSLALIHPDQNKIVTNYLFYFLRSKFMEKQIREETRTTGISDIGIKSIRKFRIYLPDYSKQEKFSQLSEKAEMILEKLQKLWKKELGLQYTLQSKAFKGELVK